MGKTNKTLGLGDRMKDYENVNRCNIVIYIKMCYNIIDK